MCRVYVVFSKVVSDGEDRSECGITAIPNSPHGCGRPSARKEKAMPTTEKDDPALTRDDELLLLAAQDLQEATSLAFRHLRMMAEGTANGDTELAFVRS